MTIVNQGLNNFLEDVVVVFMVASGPMIVILYIDILPHKGFVLPKRKGVTSWMCSISLSIAGMKA